MPRLVVGTTVVDFPNAGSDPSWAPAVIEFAQAITDQVNAIASPFDIVPRVQILTNDTNTNLTLTGAVFPSGSVRAFNFDYGIYRTNGVTAVAEVGKLYAVYNTLTASWQLENDFVGPRQANGTPYHTFDMNGDQIVLSTVALGGSYDTTNSKISFSATTQLIT